MANIEFEILIASPPNYNRLVAELHYKGKFFALVSQENDSGVFEVETPEPNLVESEVIRRVNLSEFMAALKLACERLSGHSQPAAP